MHLIHTYTKVNYLVREGIWAGTKAGYEDPVDHEEEGRVESQGFGRPPNLPPTVKLSK